MKDRCRCCLTKTIHCDVAVNHLLKATFKDLIKDFELNEGKICLTCYKNIKRILNFKNFILQKHSKLKRKKEKSKKSTENDLKTHELVVKIEPCQEFDESLQMFDSVPCSTVKTETLELDEDDDCQSVRNIEANLKLEDDSASDEVSWDWNDGQSEDVGKENKKLVKRRGRKKKDSTKESYFKHPYKARGLVFSCDLCEKVFQFKKFLQPHFVREHIKNNEERFNCEHCSEVFRHKRLWIKHLNTFHSENVGFHCYHCLSAFTSMELMQKHRHEAHIKERMGSRKEIERKRIAKSKRELKPERVLCPVCGLLLLRVCLRLHIKNVHNKERNYCCKHCGKRVAAQYALNRHIEVHHSDGAQPYSCDLCGRRFPGKQFVRNHLKRVHESKTTYAWKCEYCWKSFYNQPSLNRHLKRMHTGGEDTDGLRANPITNMFDCPICKKAFVGFMICRKHINKYHR